MQNIFGLSLLGFRMRDTFYKHLKMPYRLQEENILCSVFKDKICAEHNYKHKPFILKIVLPRFLDGKGSFNLHFIKYFKSFPFLDVNFTNILFLWRYGTVPFFFYLPVLCSAFKQRLLQRKKHINITAFLQVRRRFFNSLILKILWRLKYEGTATLKESFMFKQILLNMVIFLFCVLPGIRPAETYRKRLTSIFRYFSEMQKCLFLPCGSWN